MINFGNIKSYPTFSSYQRLKTIKSKELTERKNLKKGTIKSYKDYLDKKNGFKCCNGKGVHEQCCYCLTWKNSLNENCLDVSSKYNCFPCPKWRNVLRVPNDFVSIHIAAKGRYIIAAEDTTNGKVYISSTTGNKWKELDSSQSTIWKDDDQKWTNVVGINSSNNYIADSAGKIYSLSINSINKVVDDLNNSEILLATNSDGTKVVTSSYLTSRSNKQQIGLIENESHSDGKQTSSTNSNWGDISKSILQRRGCPARTTGSSKSFG